MKLTTSQKQILLHFVKGHISELEEYDKHITQIRRELYEKSVPTDPETQETFELLNVTRDISRDIKKSISSFASISKNLKTEIRK